MRCSQNRTRTGEEAPWLTQVVRCASQCQEVKRVVVFPVVQRSVTSNNLTSRTPNGGLPQNATNLRKTRGRLEIACLRSTFLVESVSMKAAKIAGRPRVDVWTTSGMVLDLERMLPHESPIMDSSRAEPNYETNRMDWVGFRSTERAGGLCF